MTGNWCLVLQMVLLSPNQGLRVSGVQKKVFSFASIMSQCWVFITFFCGLAPIRYKGRYVILQRNFKLDIKNK